MIIMTGNFFNKTALFKNHCMLPCRNAQPINESDHQASLGKSDLPYRILDAGSGEESLAWLLAQDSKHQVDLVWT